MTPLHHDTLMLMHTQIVGRKRWRFISPLDTPRLYNHWWHQVRSLDVSLSFSYSNLAVPNQYSFKNPAIHNW